MSLTSGTGGGSDNVYGTLTAITDITQSSGSASAKVAIEVSPGRLGMAPQLSLNYSSYRGNGWIGMGFNMDMGAIQRSTKYGINYNTSGPNANMFVEIVNGNSSELVPRTTDWGTNCYGAKIEGSLTKYCYNTAGAPGGWEVTTKDGTKYYYGSKSDRSSRQDFASGTKVFKWCLDKVQDVNGNYMIITYTKEQGEIYMSRIDYAGNSSNGLSLPTTNYITFILENRSDILTNALSPFTVNTAKRLKRIETYNNNVLQRKYVLDYQPSATTLRSLLASVTQEKDGISLPPVTFHCGKMGSNLYP